jgi:hypothetical protein
MSGYRMAACGRKAATRQSGEVSLITKVHTGAVINVGDESHDLLCLQMTTALGGGR